MAENSRHLVDPELLGLLETLPRIEISTETLPALRAAPRGQPPVALDSVAVTVRVTTHSIEGPPGAPKVQLRLYRPAEADCPLGGVFHIHGGGYVCGAAGALEMHHRHLAANLHCVVTSVDYRLAPETAFPGGIEDCFAAWCWFIEQSGALGVDTRRVGVMGESAGGGLAAALCLLARDRGGLAPAFQHLTYPMLDDRTCSSRDPHPFTGEFVFTAENNAYCWSAMLGKPAGSAEISAYAAPSRAVDLTGLPPAFISTGALDLFVEEDIEYARRLSRAGVPVELHVYPGAFHGFDLHPTARIACAAQRDSLNALRRFLEKKG